jgi:hypothetical protein
VENTGGVKIFLFFWLFWLFGVPMFPWANISFVLVYSVLLGWGFLLSFVFWLG